MLEDWNSQLTEAGEPGALAELGPASSAASAAPPDLFGLDHRAELLARWADRLHTCVWGAGVTLESQWRRGCLLLRPGLLQLPPPLRRSPPPVVRHRGRGFAVAFTVCNDALFVATSRNFVLRHDLSGDSAAGAAPPPCCFCLPAAMHIEWRACACARVLFCI